MILLKKDSEIEIIALGGAKLSRTLNQLLAVAKEGMSLKELDKLAEEMILAEGAKPSFKGYQGFPSTICANVNEGLVHGIPDDYRLRPNDLLTIDIGLIHEGFHTDMAKSIQIGTTVKDPDKEKFLKAGEEALNYAISFAKQGFTVGDISAAMHGVISRKGYNVSRIFTGHGIGRSLHEDPFIPCFGIKGQGVKLVKNMVIAIEVIYAAKSAETVTDPQNGWTATTKDKSWGGLFEHTVAITEKDARVLTK